jgi:hypothetical protein
VRDLEEADHLLVRHLFHTPGDRRARSGRADQQPFTGAGTHDECSVLVAGGASKAYA